MTYVYHAVPRNMTGTVLYPLNELQTFDPSLYQAHAAKYEGRKLLMQERIPLLNNCLWNDVIFLTAVHPAKFRQAFESAGYVRERPFQAFQFSVNALAPANTAALITMGVDAPIAFEAFDAQRMNIYDSIPEATIEYWRVQREAEVERPFLYLHIPHILYRGSLDTTNATLIEA